MVLLLSTCRFYQAALRGAQLLLLSTLLMVSSGTVEIFTVMFAPLFDVTYSPGLCVLQ